MDKKKKKYNLVQRAIFVFGILVLIGLFSLLIYQSSGDTEQPPIIEISISHQAAQPQNAYRLQVQNVGEQSAMNANISVNLYQQGELLETSTISLNYLPTGSKKEARVVFQSPHTASDSLVVSSINYEIP